MSSSDPTSLSIQPDSVARFYGHQGDYFFQLDTPSLLTIHDGLTIKSAKKEEHNGILSYILEVEHVGMAGSRPVTHYIIPADSFTLASGMSIESLANRSIPAGTGLTIGTISARSVLAIDSNRSSSDNIPSIANVAFAVAPDKKVTNIESFIDPINSEPLRQFTIGADTELTRIYQPPVHRDNLRAVLDTRMTTQAQDFSEFTQDFNGTFFAVDPKTGNAPVMAIMGGTVTQVRPLRTPNNHDPQPGEAENLLEIVTMDRDGRQVIYQVPHDQADAVSVEVGDTVTSSTVLFSVDEPTSLYVHVSKNQIDENLQRIEGSSSLEFRLTSHMPDIQDLRVASLQEYKERGFDDVYLATAAVEDYARPIDPTPAANQAAEAALRDIYTDWGELGYIFNPDQQAAIGSEWPTAAGGVTGSNFTPTNSPNPQQDVPFRAMANGRVIRIERPSESSLQNPGFLTLTTRDDDGRELAYRVPNAGGDAFSSNLTVGSPIQKGDTLGTIRLDDYVVVEATVPDGQQTHRFPADVIMERPDIVRQRERPAPELPQTPEAITYAALDVGEIIDGRGILNESTRRADGGYSDANLWQDAIKRAEELEIGAVVTAAERAVIEGGKHFSATDASSQAVLKYFHARGSGEPVDAAKEKSAIEALFGAVDADDFILDTEAVDETSYDKELRDQARSVVTENGGKMTNDAVRSF